MPDGPPPPAPGSSPSANETSQGLLRRLRAQREAARARGSQPALLRAYRALADALRELGHLDEAESAARTSVQQARVMHDDVELGESLLALARVLAGTHRTDRALLHYTEATALLAAARPQLAQAAARESATLSAVPPGAR